MRKRLMAIVMTLTLVIAMMPYSAFAAITNDSKASITINNVADGEVFKAYKIIDITYDAGTNNVSAAFNSDFTKYFDGTSAYNDTTVTIDQFAAKASDSGDLKTLLKGLPAYISADSTILPAKEVTASGTTATLAGLPMGEYLIIPSNTTSVYQLMLQKIEPTASSGTYSLSDVSFTAKKKVLGVTKTADKTSVTKGEAVTYTVTVDLPTYELSAPKKEFSITDTLDSGLTLETGSIAVKVDGDVVDAGHYGITSNGSGFTLTVDNAKYTSFWQTAAKSGKQLVITYKATLDNATTSDSIVENYSTKRKNNVVYTYSTYPYTEGNTKTKTAIVSVNSYIIKVKKVDKVSGAALAGAKFDLYRPLYSGESGGVTIPGTSVTGKKLEGDLTTDSSGLVQFKKYEANKGKYKYYLVETQAPSEYNLLKSPVEIEFEESDVSGVNDGVFTVTVENSTGLQLPITGDTGTILMSVIGLVLMGGAVVLLLLRKRKASRAK